MIKILDDIVPQQTQDNIENLITSNKFPWFYQSEMEYNVTNLTNSGITPTVGFIHPFWLKGKDNSTFSKFSLPPLNYLLDSEGLVLDKIIRIKTNLLLQVNNYTNDSFGIPHIDEVDKHYVAIYYVNDCDGDTFIFNEDIHFKGSEVTLNKRVSPKKGRILFFEGNRYHCASNPMKSHARFIINYTFTLK